MEQLAVYADMIARGIGLCAQLGYSLTVDLHPSGNDQLFGLAPRTDAGCRDDLLQPLLRWFVGDLLPNLLLTGGHQSPSPGWPTEAVA